MLVVNPRWLGEEDGGCSFEQLASFARRNSLSDSDLGRPVAWEFVCTNSIPGMGVLTPRSNHKLQERFSSWSLWLGEEDRFRTRPVSVPASKSIQKPHQMPPAPRVQRHTLGTRRLLHRDPSAR